MKLYELKSNSKWTAIILFCSLVVVLYPNTLTSQKNILLDFNLPAKTRAGTFFVLPRASLKNYFAYIGNKTLTVLSDKDVYFGAISLDTPQWTQVWGWKKSENEMEWFGTWIEVEKLPLSVATKLRIPASIVKELDEADVSIVSAQSQKMRTVLSRTDGILKSLCFKKPIESRIVSNFASPRTLPSGFSYYHTGVDMRAATGTPILASAEGEVVLAENLIVPGNTVVLYHGGGIYSQYKHLSKIEVQIGDRIERGHKLGLSGATGRVEAPHFHWEIYWKGNPTDPLQLLQAVAPICDQS